MSSRRVLFFAYADRFTSVLIALVSSIVISRLLTPAEVGVFSVAAVLLGFLAPFRDFGATQYVIQSRELTDADLISVRTIQLALGLGLGALIAGGSSFVATFYRDDRIADVMLLLAISSVMMPLGALSVALMNRELRFRALAVVRTGGNAAGALTSIVLAWRGWGPISLGVGALVATGTTSLASLALRPPRLPWRVGLSGARRVLSFGGALTVASLLNVLQQSIAELSLGRLQGLTTSALFGRAQGVVSMAERLLAEGAYAAATPLFAHHLRQGHDIGPMYLRTMGLLAAGGWTIFGLLACIAKPLVELMFGANWLDSAPVVTSLSIAFMFLTPSLLVSQALTAIGRADLVMRLTFCNTGIYVVMVVPAAFHSLQAVCMAIIAAAALILGTTVLVAQRQFAFAWRELIRQLSHSAVVAAGALTVPITILWASENSQAHAAVIVLTSAAACAVSFLAVASLSRHSIANEIAKLFARRASGV